MGAGPHNVNRSTGSGVSSTTNVASKLQELAESSANSQKIESLQKATYENIRPGKRTEQQNTNYKGLLGHYANVIREKKEEGENTIPPTKLNDTITTGFKWLSENGGEEVNQKFHETSVEVQNALKAFENEGSNGESTPKVKNNDASKKQTTTSRDADERRESLSPTDTSTQNLGEESISSPVLGASSPLPTRDADGTISLPEGLKLPGVTDVQPNSTFSSQDTGSPFHIPLPSQVLPGINTGSLLTPGLTAEKPSVINQSNTTNSLSISPSGVQQFST
jgi:hypothetical protein